MRLREIS